MYDYNEKYASLHGRERPRKNDGRDPGEVGPRLASITTKCAAVNRAPNNGRLGAEIKDGENCLL